MTLSNQARNLQAMGRHGASARLLCLKSPAEYLGACRDVALAAAVFFDRLWMHCKHVGGLSDCQAVTRHPVSEGLLGHWLDQLAVSRFTQQAKALCEDFVALGFADDESEEAAPARDLGKGQIDTDRRSVLQCAVAIADIPHREAIITEEAQPRDASEALVGPVDGFRVGEFVVIRCAVRQAVAFTVTVGRIFNQHCLLPCYKSNIRSPMGTCKGFV